CEHRNWRHYEGGGSARGCFRGALARRWLLLLFVVFVFFVVIFFLVLRHQRWAGASAQRRLGALKRMTAHGFVAADSEREQRLQHTTDPRLGADRGMQEEAEREQAGRGLFLERVFVVVDGRNVVLGIGFARAVA